jgi:hypothetical protein
MKEFFIRAFFFVLWSSVAFVATIAAMHFYSVSDTIGCVISILMGLFGVYFLFKICTSDINKEVLN